MAVEREVKFTLEQAMKARRSGKGTPYSVFNLDARCGRSFKATPRLHYPANDSVTIVQDVGRVPTPVWTGAETSSPHWDSNPGPSRSQSLFLLSYSGPRRAREKN